MTQIVRLVVEKYQLSVSEQGHVAQSDQPADDF